MRTPKNWTPPDEMPAELPPLPMGKNGRPLVYLGAGQKFSTLSAGFEGYMSDFGSRWGHGKLWNGRLNDCHYAAESDSEICRLNQWGDFDPRNKAVEPAAQTTIAAYLASAESSIQEADAAFQAATECAAAWAKELQARRDIRDRLQGDNAFARRAWFYAGMKCVRNHGKIPTTFPALPD